MFFLLNINLNSKRKTDYFKDCIHLKVKQKHICIILQIKEFQSVYYHEPPYSAVSTTRTMRGSRVGAGGPDPPLKNYKV